MNKSQPTNTKKKVITIPAPNAMGNTPVYFYPKGTYEIGTTKAISFRKKEKNEK